MRFLIDALAGMSGLLLGLVLAAAITAALLPWNRVPEEAEAYEIEQEPAVLAISSPDGAVSVGVRGRRHWFDARSEVWSPIEARGLTLDLYTSRYPTWREFGTVESDGEAVIALDSGEAPLDRFRITVDAR